MKKFKKGIYITRIIFFISCFFLLFFITNSLLQLKWYSLIFIGIYIIYVIKVITELLSKKDIYKDDIIYNLMQIGLSLYILVMFYRINYSAAVVVKETMHYFMINYGIMSILMIFIILYSFIELRISMK